MPYKHLIQKIKKKNIIIYFLNFQINDIEMNNQGRNVFYKNNGNYKMNEFIDKIRNNDIVDKNNEDNIYKIDE